MLIDGVTVYNPTHAFGFFSTFNNDVVDGVSLYKGAYPAEYGGRLGAVLDVQNRQPDPPRLRAELGVSLIAARVLVEGLAGPDHWLVGGRRTYLEPMLSALRTAENPIPDYYFYDVNAAYTTRRLGGQTTVQYLPRPATRWASTPTSTRSSTSAGATPWLSLRHERLLTDTLDGTLTLSNSRYDSYTDAEILATTFDLDNRLNDLTRPGAPRLVVPARATG